jgi:hypothetical protein
MRLRFGGISTTPPNERHQMAQQVEDKAIEQITPFGWPVSRTTHKCKFDLWVGDARVEIKGSNWRENKGCYQANIRNHAADVLIFDAVNGTDHFFIIPMAEVAPRRTVEITSYDVNAYTGQWAVYLDRWDLLAQAVAQAPPRPKQLELFTEVY